LFRPQLADFQRCYSLTIDYRPSTIAHRLLLGHVPTSFENRSTDFVEKPVEKII